MKIGGENKDERRRRIDRRKGRKKEEEMEEGRVSQVRGLMSVQNTHYISDF